MADDKTNKTGRRTPIAYAHSAEEMREKYSRKRFSSATAGKSIVYSLIYRGYQINENTPPEQRDYLYDPEKMEAIKGKVDNGNDAYLYNMYFEFGKWLPTAFESAIIARNGLKSLISHFYNLAASTLAAENLRQALGDKANDDMVELWLRTLTIESYAPQSPGRFTVTTIRDNIENALRYINSYNTLIDIIAAMIEVPETRFYRLDMDNTEGGIASLNEALDALRADASAYRMAGDASPDYIRDTLSVFGPISAEPAPIPPENITATRRRIHFMMLPGTSYTWHDLIPQMNANYWRRSFVNGTK